MPHVITHAPKTPPDGKLDRPVFVTWHMCPNCGRGPAVVFPSPRDPESDRQPKLVCLSCCPKPATAA
jgi:hypothetical protein